MDKNTSIKNNKTQKNNKTPQTQKNNKTTNTQKNNKTTNTQKNNKTTKTQKNNKTTKTITILQVNKGPSDLASRTDQLNDLIEKYKPQILAINELNSTSTDTVTRNQFMNYTLETDNLDIIDEMSRTGILIHKDIKYKRRKDLETMGISSVWIELSHPGRKPLLVQALYRTIPEAGKAWDP